MSAKAVRERCNRADCCRARAIVLALRKVDGLPSSVLERMQEYDEARGEKWKPWHWPGDGLPWAGRSKPQRKRGRKA